MWKRRDSVQISFEHVRVFLSVCFVSRSRITEKKTCYTLSVGKITLEKLLNFASNLVSVYVIIGCPFATLELSQSFARHSAVCAVITPFELQMSTLPEEKWQLRFDWKPREESELSHGDDSEGEAEVGQSRRGDRAPAPGSALTAAHETALTVHSSLAVQVLSRPGIWKGVEARADVGELGVRAAEEGRMGTASGYAHEPSTRVVVNASGQQPLSGSSLLRGPPKVSAPPLARAESVMEEEDNHDDDEDGVDGATPSDTSTSNTIGELF